MKLKQDENGLLTSAISVEMEFFQKDSLVFRNAYVLSGVASKDSSQAQSNLVDMQRIPLKAGAYKMLLKIKDLNSDQAAYELVENFTLNYSNDQIAFSHIEFVDNLKETKEQNILSKSGYDVTPYTNDLFPLNMEKLRFYTEIYNSKKVFGAHAYIYLR